MKTKKEKLEEIFYAHASPEERLAYDLKKSQKKVKLLEDLPVEVVEKEVIKEVEKKVENPITGEEIVSKVNELPTEPEKQINFEHIKNFPWHLIKGNGSDNVPWGGYGAYDLNIKAITLGQITADQDNYVTGLGSWFRISSDAARSITGFEGGTDGRGFLLTNVGAFNITLAHQNAGSAAAYRIINESGANLVLATNASAWVIYDSTTERWRAILTSVDAGTVGPATINEIAYFDTANTISSLAVATYPSLTELSYVKGVTSAIQTQFTGKLSLNQAVSQTIINGQPIQDTLTASEIVATDANKKFQSLAVATYPSLTELSYVKGATSSIQTQLNNKITGVGTAKLTVSAIAPVGPSVGDLWYDIS